MHIAIFLLYSNHFFKVYKYLEYPQQYRNNHKLTRHDNSNILANLAAEITGSNSSPSNIYANHISACYPSLSPSDLHPQLFWLITPNVILIKNCGVKGFSLPEKRVQIVAQWQTPSLAWAEMHPDIAWVVPTQPEPV